MKVRELIEKLQSAPPEAEVLTEGCDCTGDVASVQWDAKEGSVMLARSDSAFATHPIGPLL